MKFINYIFIIGFAISVSGCAHLEKKCDSGVVLQGTDTAVVGLYIDNDGFPRANVGEVVLSPGQRVVFAGPNQFEIFFKDQRSPNGQLENRSNNGIVVIDIPRDIFERSARINASATTVSAKELIYRYGIRANGKVTDPIIKITPTGQ
jgi:hypothetical protein